MRFGMVVPARRAGSRVLLTLLGAACSARPAADADGGAPSGAPHDVADSIPGTGAPPAAGLGTMVGLNVQWGEHFNAGDAGALSGLYSEDAVLMTTGGDIRGRAAIRDHFARWFAERPDTILQSNMQTETLEIAGDRAYEAGTISYRVRPRGHPAAAAREATVRYVTFWKQQPDGRWLIQRSLQAR